MIYYCQAIYFTITQAVLCIVQCHIPLFVAITQAVLCKIDRLTITNDLKFARGKAACNTTHKLTVHFIFGLVYWINTSLNTGGGVRLLNMFNIIASLLMSKGCLQKIKSSYGRKSAVQGGGV